MALRVVAYVSRAAPGTDRARIGEIVAVSRRNNAAADVTGAMVHDGGFYAQVLEGPAPAVDALLERIAADPRHGDMQIVHEADVEARAFPTWRMEIFDLDGSDAAGVEVRTLREQLRRFLDDSAAGERAAFVPIFFRMARALAQDEAEIEHIVVRPPSLAQGT